MKTILFAVVLALAPVGAIAQELVADEVTVSRARVAEVVTENRERVPGTDVERVYQLLRVRILEGDEAGMTVDVDNDYAELEAGDTFYLAKTVSDLEGSSYYSVMERDRVLPLAALALLFVAAVVAFGGKQGIRGLAALCASLVFIWFLLLPGILDGYSPVFVSLGVAALIVLIGSYVTHGVNWMTTSAVIGMIVTIAVTGLLAFLSIEWSALQGWTGEEVTYLHLNTNGAIDLAGLLLGGILIGLLGVLYDAAIGQAVSVEEIARANAALSRRDVYARALRIGREHVGALVNTLAIAYIGAALPLMLLMFGSEAVSFGPTVSREIFATEIVRILVGSIGLVLAVPVTTAVSVAILMRPEMRAGARAQNVAQSHHRH